MARNNSDDAPGVRVARSGSDDDFEPMPRSGGAAPRSKRPAADLDDDIDPRLLDLDVEEESPFLRAQKRVPVRRGALPRKTADRLKIATIALICFGIVFFAAYQLYHYGSTSWRFRIDSSDDIQVSGLENVSRSQVMETFGTDIGRNIFFVPLTERRRQLEQIPWVESAAVMRLLPHEVRVQITERKPVAFAQVGSRIQLVDASGVLMDLPRSAKKYSFPVLIGMSEAEPLSTRSARMKIYNRVIADLDRDGAHNSQGISEVDLRDPGDVKIMVADDDGAVLVHLGDTDFLQRFQIYQSNLQDWRQKHRKLESVDLRYYPQVIVNPDRSAAVSATVNSAGAAAAPAAGKGVPPTKSPAPPAKKGRAAPPR